LVLNRITVHADTDAEFLPLWNMAILQILLITQEVADKFL